MNLQRREEIRAIAKEFRRLFLHEQAEAIDELLAYVDALEQAAAERVIADGSRGPGVAPAVVVPENLLHDLAVAAWDEGADAGMVWDPDSDPAKRGVAPCTPEEGIAKARDHFAKHGSGSPSSAFSRALQAIRENSRAIPADRVLGEGMAAVKWISVNDALPEDGQTVGFVTECANDKWYHGRVLGGRYMAGEFGGFSVPGLMVQASHWFAFPPLPDALRANQGGAAT